VPGRPRFGHFFLQAPTFFKTCAAARGDSDDRDEGKQVAVRKVLDAVKADGRTSLTAPEGKLVADAYGIPVPGEGVATSAADAATLARA